MQFEQKESIQQIADFKDWLSKNRARTKDSKGNEEQVLVQVFSEDHCRSSINLFMTSLRLQRESCRLFQILARMILSTVHLV